jgi:RNA polymerase sigma factor (sigma-70 family)
MTTALSTGIRRAAARIAPDPAPDGELLSRFLAARDEAAFAVLVRRHAAMVFGTCRRVLGNAPDADDAFQAAFVVLVRKAHSLTDRACVGNFLYGVAFHTALKARAMTTKRKAKEARASRTEPAADQGELSRALDEELAKLPEKYREPVVLCELEGVGRRDAAGRLGVPEGTISSRLATAHRMLEKRLKARGFATVAIAAVLGNQAFAVSDSLADAAVRAAVNGSPAGVTHLAAEVTKMFLLTKLKVGAAVLAGVVLLLAACVGFVQRGVAADDKAALKAPVPKKDEKDQDRVQGLWQAESLEAGGQKAPDEAVKAFQVRFKGTDITFAADDRTHTFDLDSSTMPKALNLTPGDGPAKGKKLECAIYDLDGDTLKICMDKEGQAGKRPTEFKTTPNDGLALMVLKRVKEKSEPPGKKPDSDKEYSLAPGEVLKLIPSPFPAGREKVFDRIPANKRTGSPFDTNLLAVSVGDGWAEVSEFTARRWKAGDPVKPPQLLQYVKHLVGIDTATVSDPNWLLESTVLDADVVVRKGAKPEELLAALSRELKAKCGADVTFAFREVETEVVVLSGKHTLKRNHAFPGRPYNDAARVALTDKPLAGSGGRGTAQLPAELATYLGRPVVDESDLKTNDVAVWITSPSYDTRPQAADRDPAKVLKSFADQTGLTAKLEKRKVRAAVVQHEEVKK